MRQKVIEVKLKPLKPIAALKQKSVPVCYVRRSYMLPSGTVVPQTVICKKK